MFGTAMQGYLMSDDSVAEQTELLVAYLCPTADNPEECDTGIRFYWPKFGKFTEINSCPIRLDPCKRSCI